jgi:hypothetical protein
MVFKPLYYMMFIVMCLICSGYAIAAEAHNPDALLESLLNNAPETDKKAEPIQKQTYSLQQQKQDQLLPHKDDEEPKDVRHMNLEDIPDRYLKEAEEYRQYCQQRNLLRTYYNCDCMALEYLQTRIDLGPSIDRTAIIIKIGGTCVDVTNAAGLAYKECKDMWSLLGLRTNEERYCSCVGSTYAKMYKAAGLQPSSRVFSRIKNNAMSVCRRQIYTP